MNLYAYCANNPVYYVDPSGHICEKRANEIMGKLGAGGVLSNSESKKLAAFLRNKERRTGGLTDAEQRVLEQVDRKKRKKNSGIGSKWGSSAGESGKNTATTIDYSYKFDGELANFNDCYEVRTNVDKDLILVQYSSDALDVSLCYWTTVDEANRMTTLNEYMDKLALSRDWGKGIL